MAVLDPASMLGQAYEPVQKHRFYMLIENVPPFMVKAVTLPSVEANKVELHHINQIRKVKGKTTYGDATITLYNPIGPSGPQIIAEWMRLQHEATTGRDGYSDFYKKDCTFQMLDPVGAIISEFVFKGCWVTNYTPGEFDFEQDGQVTSTLTLSVDWMEVNF